MTPTAARGETVSLGQLRRFVVAHQDYAARFRRGTIADAERAIERMSAVQLDSITTVERSHRLVLGARIGQYPAEAESALLASGRAFEYWAYERSLIPIELYPHFRARMRTETRWRVHRLALEQHGHLVEPLLAQIRERGPQPARAFLSETPGRAEMWDRKPENAVLEALWNRGDLAVAGRANFQRLYDLTERVIPRKQLEQPVPTHEETLRELAERAVRARGALTEGAIVEHWRLRGGVRGIRPHVDALVAAGSLRRVSPDDGGPPVVVAAAAVLAGATPRAGVLLSPFDNLLWDRPFLERFFGFRHLIEIYKPAHQRVYGYYVLPFLFGDLLVGRADLKVDRAEGALRVQTFHLEPGVRGTAALEDSLDAALARLARTLGLTTIER